MRLRQIALVARELGGVREDLFAVLGLHADFKDPGVAEFGLQNSVMALGDTFLEVVAPVEENTPAGRFLARRGGDGGYMVLVQVDDLAQRRAEVERLGVRVVWEVKGKQAAGFHMHPKDVGGAIVSFDQMWPPDSWKWAGPDWEHRRAANVSTIIAVDIQSPDPRAMASRWSEVFNRPAAGNTLELESGCIRFVPDEDGRGPGVSAVDLSATDTEAAIAAARQRGLSVDGNEIRICGTAFRLR
jgi:Glyoxalase-like domain